MPETGRRTRGFRPRAGVLFALLCLAALALALGYAWRAASRRAMVFGGDALPELTDLGDLASQDQEHGQNQEQEASLAEPSASRDEEPSVEDATEQSSEQPPAENGSAEREGEHLLFIRHTGLDASYGVVSAVRLGAFGEDRRGVSLRCDRLHFSRDRGVCLTTDRVYTSHSIMLFDRSFETLYTLPLNGIPSRARVSPDGRRAAVTVFVSGHSYADEAFSTETSIIDTNTGRRIVGNLEELAVWDGGRRLRTTDMNFWGVTFANDGDRFYATLGTGGRVSLVEGRVSDRRVTVLRDGIECPSLSPDQTRIAFKRRVPVGAGFVWRLHVLDLETSAEIPLSETRHVDDQVEWLDNATILYALPDPSAPTARVTDVWQVSASGEGEPALFLHHAFSPTVLDRSDVERVVPEGPR